MSSERQRRERCGSKASWQTVRDMWAGDRKTPHPQCCRCPWHEQCLGVRRSEMSLAGYGPIKTAGGYILVMGDTLGNVPVTVVLYALVLDQES